MIKLELKNEEGQEAVYNLPTDWKEITVRQFNSLQRLIKKEYTNNVEMSIDLLHALTECPLPVIERMNAKQFTPLVEHLTFVKDFDKQEFEEKSEIIIDGEAIKIKKEFNDDLSVKDMMAIENVLRANGDITLIIKFLLDTDKVIDVDSLLISEIYPCLMGFQSGKAG